MSWPEEEVGEEPDVFHAGVWDLHHAFTRTPKEQSHHCKPCQHAGRRGNGSFVFAANESRPVYMFLISVSSPPLPQGLLPG